MSKAQNSGTGGEKLPLMTGSMRELNIYDCLEIEKQIEALAAANDGEITETQMEALILAQTTSMEKLEGLCDWLKKIDLFILACKSEEERIKKMRQYAEKRIKRTHGWITPFVQSKKKIEVGTHTLSVRRSTRVFVPDEFDDPYYVKEKIVKTPDKKAIKEALGEGVEVEGCSLQTYMSLQRK